MRNFVQPTSQCLEQWFSTNCLFPLIANSSTQYALRKIILSFQSYVPIAITILSQRKHTKYK